MKYLIKLGGSVFSPKHTPRIKQKYLQSLAKILRDYREKHAITLVHGGGYHIHNFILQKGLHKDNYHECVQEHNRLYRLFYEHFPWFKKVSHYEYKNNILPDYPHILTGCYVTPSLEDIGSDGIMTQLANKNHYDQIIFLTDVDGVLTKQNKILPELKQYENLEKIHFWKKEFDDGRAMQQKVDHIFAMKQSNLQYAYVINGFHLKRLQSLLEGDQKVLGTKVYITHTQGTSSPSVNANTSISS